MLMKLSWAKGVGLPTNAIWISVSTMFILSIILSTCCKQFQWLLDFPLIYK